VTVGSIETTSGCQTKRVLFEHAFVRDGDATMKGIPTELRVDASDGVAYPRSSFLEVYGQIHGMRIWESSAPKGRNSGGGRSDATSLSSRNRRRAKRKRSALTPFCVQQVLSARPLWDLPRRAFVALVACLSEPDLAALSCTNCRCSKYVGPRLHWRRYDRCPCNRLVCILRRL